MAKIKQSIKNGTLVQFYPKDYCLQDFIGEDKVDNTDSMHVAYKMLFKYQKSLKLRVHSLETYAELGEKDHEYYNVEFQHKGTLYKLTGISGYHLYPITNAKK